MLVVFTAFLSYKNCLQLHVFCIVYIYTCTCNVLHMHSQSVDTFFIITVTDFVTLSLVMKVIKFNHNSIVHIIIIYVKGQN